MKKLFSRLFGRKKRRAPIWQRLELRSYNADKLTREEREDAAERFCKEAFKSKDFGEAFDDIRNAIYFAPSDIKSRYGDAYVELKKKWGLA